MHAYLKTIGFSKIKTTKELQEILRDVVENYDRKKIVETEEHHLFAEFSKEYAYDCGITVCGEIDENNRLSLFRGRADQFLRGGIGGAPRR